jgi:NAD(P)-dependent dehydrogenase (short-subunit alcohol dehydrogenase family)
MMPADVDGRVVVVTGAGRGIGRCHALELARRGARIVVNDLGVELDGSGRSEQPAQAVVEEIRAAGGEAVASHHDVADWDDAQALVRTAVDVFGGLDVLVNNAGILRDRMLVNMDIEEWDAIMRFHLRATFAPSRWAATYWRDCSRAGEPRDARLVSTSSPSGLYGNVGQSNYGAAKAGIAAFTVIAATELARYGVTANAIAPGALTRMTEGLGIVSPDSPEQVAAFAPEAIAPLVVWLASRESAGVTGRVFNVQGGTVSVAEGWQAGPSATTDGHWDADALAEVVPELVRQAAPNAGMDGRRPAGID